ncbi:MULTISPECIES: histidine kinase [Amniculibacterium]|uniref:histidine kinase n=1 Tax=Amniculibacterium TaxID=2715289 RepID=UPI000F5A51AA|nr:MULTISPECIES: histidine kinase [Amniculibacterium]
MKSIFYNLNSRKPIFIIAIVVCVIAFLAFVVSSFLITNESKKINEESARKAFQNKYIAISNVFSNIENYQISLNEMTKNRSENEIKTEFELLNKFKIQQNIKPYNWVSNVDNEKNLFPYFFKNKINNQKDFSTKSFLTTTKQNSCFVTVKDSMFWVNYQKNRSPEFNGYYGFTINLNNLHDYFSEVTQSQNNYAFVFSKDGTCITHPEQKFIGKNVFGFTNIVPKDTITPEMGNTERKVNSEYLNLEVLRFIKPLKTRNFDGYVAVNYVNFLIDENVNKTKNYIIYIFLATILLISIIFIVFHQATNNAYKEKELVQNEKNKLLIINEEMHKENAINQLQQLKNQINPHFLFNSLNSLYMLIGLDPQKAQKFTMNLSKIYRYIIIPPKENLVLVKDELKFINPFMDLQKSRFEDEIQFEKNIEIPENLNKKIPYLSLQIVVENAIKHNIATVDHPLFIKLYDSENGIFVINTYQPKQKKPVGEHFGLNYLQKTCTFYKNDEFRTWIDKDQFHVFIPFLDTDYPFTP